jgi:hypothetical protein
MQTKTDLHQLLRDFRDLTDAQLCMVVSKRGARVFVGRPMTLSAEQLAGSQGAEHAGDDAEARRLTKSIVGYAVTVEFESQAAADKARGSFEELVDIIEQMVSNDLDPESTPKPSGR